VNVFKIKKDELENLQKLKNRDKAIFVNLDSNSHTLFTRNLDDDFRRNSV
jgi:hypothetical protein